MIYDSTRHVIQISKNIKILAKNEDFNTISNENEDEENIDDFITEN